MRHLPLSARIAITLLLGVCLVFWLLSRPVGEVERVGFQGFDPPLVMPADGQIDHRFDFPSAWRTAEIPLAVRFDPPMGHLVYNAQAFWEMNKKRGGHHTGDDLNGIGGMNTDLGDPVYAVADGLVLYAGEPSESWGLTVIVAHRTLDGRQLHSMYAHLDAINVAMGSLVGRGMRVGTVGTGNGHYPAHLHFEMRESHHVDIGRGYLAEPLNRLDPLATIAALRHATAQDRAGSPLALLLGQGREAWTGMEIKGAEIFSRLPNGE